MTGRYLSITVCFALASIGQCMSMRRASRRQTRTSIKFSGTMLPTKSFLRL